MMIPEGGFGHNDSPPAPSQCITVEFASADPADWVADPTEDEIQFTVFGLAEVSPMPWQNRPTYQQVVQVERKRP